MKGNGTLFTVGKISVSGGLKPSAQPIEQPGLYIPGEESQPLQSLSPQKPRLTNNEKMNLGKLPT